MPLSCVDMAGEMQYQPWAVFILGEDLGWTIWLHNINCNGMERLLGGCSLQAWGEHNYGHDREVGIACSELKIIELVKNEIHFPSKLLKV